MAFAPEPGQSNLGALLMALLNRRFATGPEMNGRMGSDPENAPSADPRAPVVSPFGAQPDLGDIPDMGYATAGWGTAQPFNYQHPAPPVVRVGGPQRPPDRPLLHQPPVHVPGGPQRPPDVRDAALRAIAQAIANWNLHHNRYHL